MTTATTMPDNIRSLLDRAALHLQQGKHGDASALLWQAAAASIRYAAQSRGETLRTDSEMESFIDALDATVPPGVGLMAGYLNALEFKANGNGDLMDCEDVVFYEPVIKDFVSEILELPI